MTITDHDCTKAVILVPCNENIDAEGVARLFKDRVFPFVGLPKRIISDRDTRFTSAFFKELCAQLGIKQNLSTAYHPQTDGQSEKTNQHVETALRIYCNHQQDNCAKVLPIVQYAINARTSATTKQAPYVTNKFWYVSMDWDRYYTHWESFKMGSAILGPLWFVTVRLWID